MSGKQDNNNESTQAQPPLISKTTSRLIWSVQDINALFNINIQYNRNFEWERVMPDTELPLNMFFWQIAEKLVRLNIKLPSFW